MPNKPLLIGVTGGIGSGKSLVCQIFEVLGVPVYYADDRAKYLVQFNSGLKASIINTFGKESFEGELYNKAYISSLVFNSPERLKELNSLIHPVVAQDFEAWVQTKASKGYPYILKEAALLFDGDNRRGLDKIFVVTAPASIRLERVLLRDPLRGEVQIKDIMARQMPEDRMIAQSDGTIDNSGNKLLIPQILLIHQALA